MTQLVIIFIFFSGFSFRYYYGRQFLYYSLFESVIVVAFDLFTVVVLYKNVEYFLVTLFSKTKKKQNQTNRGIFFLSQNIFII